MSGASEFEQLSRFTLEAAEIIDELGRPGGVLSTKAPLEDPRANIVREAILDRDRPGLVALRSDFLEILRDLKGDIGRIVDSRLVEKSGISRAMARSAVLRRGAAVFDRRRIANDRERADLESYWNLLKDSNLPLQFEVEKLLARTAACPDY